AAATLTNLDAARQRLFVCEGRKLRTYGRGQGFLLGQVDPGALARAFLGDHGGQRIDRRDEPRRKIRELARGRQRWLRLEIRDTFRGIDISRSAGMTCDHRIPTPMPERTALAKWRNQRRDERRILFAQIGSGKPECLQSSGRAVRDEYIRPLQDLVQ